ncbi:DUF413 domain-containing protein [Parendozoicomonas haliclonae]|uniref:Macrodomain Ori protein n=1 Tax=Parendozoicomonas haliclonae TaxID=1960125 RepID=A0A1X7AQ74_9GAMM|nr:DUF413 domain-containing protein [Parendozoicomonas haliclonae]SMA50395.1 hypothetical protein EHSB41UT_04192 [Parendozoicomonas haliclonae]
MLQVEETQGFERGASRWYDNVNCPHGFARSGHFTLKQAEFLEWYGRSLKALTAGEVLAGTPEQEELLKVVTGEKPAETFAEKTWNRYVQILTPHWVSFCSEFSPSSDYSSESA